MSSIWCVTERLEVQLGDGVVLLSASSPLDSLFPYDFDSLLLCPSSAADETDDQYKLLQLENNGWLIFHVMKPLVQVHKPLDQRSGEHWLYLFCHNCQ